jgi:hypothetical protein
MYAIRCVVNFYNAGVITHDRHLDGICKLRLFRDCEQNFVTLIPRYFPTTNRPLVRLLYPEMGDMIKN